ncbi:dentin matrix acidic phosphoprotein 1-like isoform X2 [Haliotis asinina]|uniref:dentin matrix acidic phosphoprotein 1-like isoform X2 n=1 Tax=Haliotis asinina TaxID=109174 RepID=UPI0035320265
MTMGAVLPALCVAVVSSSLFAATGTTGLPKAATQRTSTSTPSTQKTTAAATQASSTLITNAAWVTLFDSDTSAPPLTSVENPPTHTTTSPSTSTPAATASTVTTSQDCTHCASNSSCDIETNSSCLYLLCDPVTGSCYGDCEDGWFGDKCDRDQSNETSSNTTTATDSGSSLGSMEIAIITLSLLLAVSVAVNIIIVVVKIKTKFRKIKGKAVFHLERNQYSLDRHETVALKALSAVETLEYQPNTGQPQFQDDEYEVLAVGTENAAYEIPVRNTIVQPDLAKTNTKTFTPPMPVPGPRADTVTLSRLSDEPGQREGNAVPRIRFDKTPVQNVPLPPVPSERRSRNQSPEPSESPDEDETDGSENILRVRDSLALHAQRIGLTISKKRRSGAYTLPDDEANYSVSDIEEDMESEEDPDDGLYENEVVTGDDKKKPTDMDDDSDPYENEDFIDTQFRRLKYKYKLSPDDRVRADNDCDDDPLNTSTNEVDDSEDDDEERGGTIRKASMAVQYNSNDHIHDLEVEESEEGGGGEVEEDEEEAAGDEVFDEESRGPYTGDSSREPEYLNYRTVNGLVVSVDAIIDEGDDDDDYDADDRDLYENEMVWRRNIGRRDEGGASTERNVDGQKESFPGNVSGDEARDMGQEDAGFVVDSTQSLTGDINGMVGDEEDEDEDIDEDEDGDVVQDGKVNDVHSDGCYDEASSFDPNMKPEQTDPWETPQSTENGSDDGIPSESSSPQNEFGRRNNDDGLWGGAQKRTWSKNESPQNGFAENEFNPDKFPNLLPASRQRQVRWTIGDSESSGQTIGDEDLNEWSQALDSDFQQDPRGPVTVFESESDEYDV